MGSGLDGRGSIPAGQEILFTTQRPDRLWGPPASTQLVPGTLSTGVKQQGREADHSDPSSAEVKNGGAISPFSHTSSWRVVN
jgi:hypothetical protein